MPGAYGGGDNPPVRLDPWQEIIEVGWNRITHLALTVSIGIKDVVVLGHDTCPTAERYTDDYPDYVFRDTYFSSFIYHQDDEGGLVTAHAWNGRNWNGSVSGELSGLPALGSITLPEWKYHEQENEGPFVSLDYPTHNRRFRPIDGNPAEGEEPSEEAIPVPDLPDKYFGGTAAQYEMSGFSFEAGSAPFCYEEGSPGVPSGAFRLTGGLISDAQFDGDPHAPDRLDGWPESLIGYDVSGMTIVVDETTTFNAVGAYAAEFSTTLWILFERDEI